MLLVAMLAACGDHTGRTHGVRSQLAATSAPQTTLALSLMEGREPWFETFVRERSLSGRDAGRLRGALVRHLQTMAEDDDAVLRGRTCSSDPATIYDLERKRLHETVSFSFSPELSESLALLLSAQGAPWTATQPSIDAPLQPAPMPGAQGASERLAGSSHEGDLPPPATGDQSPPGPQR